MKRVPLVYTASEIVRWTVSQEYAPGKWRPARPCGFCSFSWDHLKMRFKIAWHVFIGRYDALNWQGTGGLPNSKAKYKDCLDPDFQLVTAPQEPK